MRLVPNSSLKELLEKSQQESGAETVEEAVTEEPPTETEVVEEVKTEEAPVEEVKTEESSTESKE